jgi:hypothetical protein
MKMLIRGNSDVSMKSATINDPAISSPADYSAKNRGGGGNTLLHAIRQYLVDDFPPLNR